MKQAKGLNKDQQTKTHTQKIGMPSLARKKINNRLTRRKKRSKLHTLLEKTMHSKFIVRFTNEGRTATIEHYAGKYHVSIVGPNFKASFSDTLYVLAEAYARDAIGMEVEYA